VDKAGLNTFITSHSISKCYLLAKYQSFVCTAGIFCSTVLSDNKETESGTVLYCTEHNADHV
jgi:hypothetical protein